MHKFVLALACLCCVGHGHRLQKANTDAEAQQRSKVTPLSKLALLLVASSPVAGFRPLPGSLPLAKSSYMSARPMVPAPGWNQQRTKVPALRMHANAGGMSNAPNDAKRWWTRQRPQVLTMSMKDDSFGDGMEDDFPSDVDPEDARDRIHHRRRSPAQQEELPSMGAEIQGQEVAPIDVKLRDKVFKLVESIAKPLQYVAQDSTRVRYTIPMITRVGYFLSQGVTLSAVGYDRDPDAAKTPIGLNPTAVIGALQDALLADDVDTLAEPEAELADKLAKEASNDELQRILFAKNFASIFALLKKDLKNIEDGEYKLPYDMEPVGGAGGGVIKKRQWNPLAVAKQALQYVRDRQEVIDRRQRKDGFEVRKTWSSKMYPKYYLQNFHYQTDGWLSSKSARLYDYQVESLFLGTADAMRRQVLPELRRHLAVRGRTQEKVKLLDAATGTGRFASFVLDNHPNLDTTVLDLSPFYLQEARTLLKRFPQVEYMQAAAEDIPAEDETYDAVTCVYLFHELPYQIRKLALREFFRVLKPGGKLFFVDSAQKGEVPYDSALEGFTSIAHEPYYLDYSEMDLSGTMKEVGFQVESSKVHWVSKSMVAVKPNPEEDAEWAADLQEGIDATDSLVRNSAEYVQFVEKLNPVTERERVLAVQPLQMA